MDYLKIVKNECITCDVILRHKNKNRCRPCLFKIGADGAETGKIFKEYRVELGIPKSRFFYFAYNTELNWEYPELPDVDIFENKKEGRVKWHWVIHHEDGDHSNDNKWNLCLLLNTEHHTIHNLERNPMDGIKRDDFIKIIRKKYKERYIQNKNLDKNKVKYYKMIDWLNSISKGEYILNKKICDKLNYTEPFSLKYGINSAIVNNEVNNIFLKHNGKENSARRWILLKE